MRKEEIYQKLDSLGLAKKDYIVVTGSSLVLHDIISETEDIDLACSKEVFDSLDWPIRYEYGGEIKYHDDFDINYNLFDLEHIDVIDGYQCSDLVTCYELKKKMDKAKDRKLIQKLELMVCSNDNYYFERTLKKQGIHLIAGIDEVGRGPLVGPVVAACCILPEEFHLEGLTDSKKLSEKKRDYFYEEIKKQALAYGIGIIDERKIDEVNIYEATKLAMKEAILNMSVKPDHVLIDAMPLELDIPTTSIIKGDLKSITISAASVLAKVTRDRMLYELDEKYPMYDFKDNKGYPTKKHLAAIEEYGIIDEHRRSYGPVKEYLENHK